MSEVKMGKKSFIAFGLVLILLSYLGGMIQGIAMETPESFTYDEAVKTNAVITVYGYDVENNVKEFAIYTTNPEQIKIYDFEEILEVEGEYIYSFVNYKRAIIDVREK